MSIGSESSDQGWDTFLIVKCLERHVTLVRDWKQFYDALGVTDTKVIQWESAFQLGAMPPYTLFSNILESWKSEKGSAATLQSMCEILKKIQKVEVSESLEKELNLSTDNSEIFQIKESEEEMDFGEYNSDQLDPNSVDKFVAVANEVSQWILEQMPIVSSQEYGQNVEEVEKLIHDFHLCYNSILKDGEHKVLSVLKNAKPLCEKTCAFKDIIISRSNETTGMWESFKDLANKRAKALQRAQTIHGYVRKADQLIASIHEETCLIDINCERNFDSNKKLHSSLAAVSATDRLFEMAYRVESAYLEARILCGEFPDAKYHIDDKLNEIIRFFNDFLAKQKMRKFNLEKADEFKAYFDHYSKILEFITEMIAKVTALKLGDTVNSSKFILQQHNTYKDEYDSKISAIKSILNDGWKLIEQRHFLSFTLNERQDLIDLRKSHLEAIWTDRENIYLRLLDLQCRQQCHWNSQNDIEKKRIDWRKTKGESWLFVAEDQLTYNDFNNKLRQINDKIISCAQELTLIKKEWKVLVEKEQKMWDLEADKVIQTQAKIIEMKKQHLAIYLYEKINEDQTVLHSTTPGNSVREDNISRDSNLSISTNTIETETKNRPSRTISFTTGKYTTSLHKLTPVVEIAANLERKQYKRQGKSPKIRPWKTYFTVLGGHSLGFFKNKQDFINSKCASPSISVYKCDVEKVMDYKKKKFVFRIRLIDESEFLFASQDKTDFERWVVCLSAIRLPEPRHQLNFEKRNSDPTVVTSRNLQTASSSEITGSQFSGLHQDKLPTTAGSSKAASSIQFKDGYTRVTSKPRSFSFQKSIRSKHKISSIEASCEVGKRKRNYETSFNKENQEPKANKRKSGLMGFFHKKSKSLPY